jgi:hypothetical protein
MDTPGMVCWHTMHEHRPFTTPSQQLLDVPACAVSLMPASSRAVPPAGDATVCTAITTTASSPPAPSFTCHHFFCVYPTAGLPRMYELWPDLNASTLAASDPKHLALALRALSDQGPPRRF